MLLNFRIEKYDREQIQPIKMYTEGENWSSKGPDSIRMNRYLNILPYDDTRFFLKMFNHNSLCLLCNKLP